MPDGMVRKQIQYTSKGRKFRAAFSSSQGQRILIDEHQAQIVVVPSRLLLASLNPTLVGLLLAQQVESDMAYHRQDLGTMVLTDATSIFIEADVQHIM